MKHRPKIDIQKFCEHGSMRGLERPFSQGKWTYATDGKIIIRVARRADVPENMKAPSCVCKNTFDSIQSTGKYFRLPKFKHPKMSTCFACQGSLKTRCGCHHCKGDHPCETCNATGVIEEKLPSVRVGNKNFSAHYLAMIDCLPNVRVASGKTAIMEMVFRFTGGEGILMPLA